MLLNRGLSWRQRGRPQFVDPPQDLGEHGSGLRHLGELKGDAAVVAHVPDIKIHQLLAQRGQRPRLLASGRCSAASGDARVSSWLAAEVPAHPP